MSDLRSRVPSARPLPKTAQRDIDNFFYIIGTEQIERAKGTKGYAIYKMYYAICTKLIQGNY